MSRDDRERFEQECRDWIRLMSRDAACRLEALPAVKKKAILKAYDDFRDPLAVFRGDLRACFVKSSKADSEFSQRTYDLFMREILLNLRDANHGYG